uniref:Uncharacterized protein n=1 Tax=Strigops habroptila TaxID=2489341 RepID=A0A672TES2_STRHB
SVSISPKQKKKLLEELGENRLPCMTPANADFHQLWKTKHSKMIFRKSDTVPEELHQMKLVQCCVFDFSLGTVLITHL